MLNNFLNFSYTKLQPLTWILNECLDFQTIKPLFISATVATF